jgi:hypothetical protein
MIHEGFAAGGYRLYRIIRHSANRHVVRTDPDSVMHVYESLFSCLIVRYGETPAYVSAC